MLTCFVPPKSGVTKTLVSLFRETLWPPSYLLSVSYTVHSQFRSSHPCEFLLHPLNPLSKQVYLDPSSRPSTQVLYLQVPSLDSLRACRTEPPLNMYFHVTRNILGLSLHLVPKNIGRFFVGVRSPLHKGIQKELLGRSVTRRHLVLVFRLNLPFWYSSNLSVEEYL